MIRTALANLLFLATVHAVTPEPREFAACEQWTRAAFADNAHPYSWRGGDATGLEITHTLRRFDDFPAVEWTVRLRNPRDTASQIVEDIQALDANVPLRARKNAQLHWSRGGVASFDDFRPELTALTKTAFHLDSREGRSSGAVMPYFNVRGDDGGVIIAIGWSGSWAADFAWDPAAGLSVKAGMRRTHLRLEAGESVRTPSIALLFYSGDRWRGQNLWRQFVLKHHRPQHNGKPLIAPITNGNWGGTAARVHLDNIAQIERHRLPVEYYWIDAEWYGGAGSWSVNTGNWEVKRALYPDGFRPLSEALARNGRNLMLWFEPERVVRGTPWAERKSWLIDTGRSSLLMNLGNPDARRFVTDFIASRVRDYGLGCYRQDFNMDPLPYWTSADAPDRVGATEMHYIEGLYAFWDELLASFPGLLIDNCASGGRRLDFEALTRSVPYWRTDGPRDPVAHQAHTWGLLPWVPLNATSVDHAADDYDFRSGMSSALCLNWWVRDDVPADVIPASFPFDWARRTLEQYRSFRHLYYGDFYPLTEYGQTNDTWMAYQLSEPAEGLVAVLKRAASPYRTARFALRALESGARYQVEWLDHGIVGEFAGKQLAEDGLEVRLTNQPDSALFRYRKSPAK